MAEVINNKEIKGAEKLTPEKQVVVLEGQEKVALHVAEAKPKLEELEQNVQAVHATLAEAATAEVSQPINAASEGETANLLEAKLGHDLNNPNRVVDWAEVVEWQQQITEAYEHLEDLLNNKTN